MSVVTFFNRVDYKKFLWIQTPPFGPRSKWQRRSGPYIPFSTNEKMFSHRVIPAIAFSAHATYQPSLLELSPIDVACVFELAPFQ